MTLPHLNKYTNDHIDWQTLFYVLNDSEHDRVTSFKACKRKQFKIKLLLQLLPTMTTMNARYPQTYVSNTCFRCNSFTEDFDHIWTCNNNSKSIDNIIQDTKSTFMSHLIDLNRPNNNIPLDYVSQSPLWNCSSTNNNLCFLDLLKGIIPSSFSSSINAITKNKQLTLGVLSSLFDDIYSSIHDIWIERCNELQIWKTTNNVTDDFTIAWASSGCPRSHYTHTSNPSSFTDAITFGTHWSNFWYGSNHALPSGRLMSVF